MQPLQRVITKAQRSHPAKGGGGFQVDASFDNPCRLFNGRCSALPIAPSSLAVRRTTPRLQDHQKVLAAVYQKYSMLDPIGGKPSFGLEEWKVNVTPELLRTIDVCSGACRVTSAHVVVQWRIITCFFSHRDADVYQRRAAGW